MGNWPIVAALVLVTVLCLATLVACGLLVVDKMKRTSDFDQQAENYPHADDSEWGERAMARLFTPADARVLELGGGAGSVSAVVQEILTDKTKHVVVQPADGGMLGGLPALLQTRAACNSQFTVVDHVLQSGEGDAIVRALGGAPTCLVVDCENCLVGEYAKNPQLFTSATMVQVERDDFDGSYTSLLRDTLKLKLKHSGKGCGGMCATEVWVK